MRIQIYCTRSNPSLFVITLDDYRQVFRTDNSFMTYELKGLFYTNISTKVENYSTSFLTKVKRFFK